MGLWKAGDWVVVQNYEKDSQNSNWPTTGD
jgi:hypothetical protein